ncbi:HlyD family secretion protein [Leptolyngbya sp. PL-A3]|uniref:HlyD family secretion protein n=1 Tax=Leptolyngbya sp. PL-A3 TaxID=2933911 RepID=UPI00329967AF
MKTHPNTLNGKSALLESPTAPTEPIAERATVVEASSPAEATPEAPSETTAKAPKKRPSKLLLAALGIGAIAASGFGFRWWQYASTHEETDNAAVAGHLYQISSRIPGTVSQVTVDDNEVVKPGELLVQLDPHDYEVKVQQAQAALQVAQQQAQAAQGSIAQVGTTAQAQTTEAQGNIAQAVAAISSAQAAVAEAQAGVPAAQAQLAQANATLQQTQADYARYQSLFESGAVARQQLDAARAAFEVAQAQRNAAQQGVSQAQAKVDQAQQGVGQAQAQLEASRSGLQQAQATGQQTNVNRSQYEAAVAAIAQAQAQLNAAQLQLSYTQITAPAEGRIGRKTVEVGQQVQAGQPLMAVVGDDLWIIANFKETQMDDIKPGESVEIELDAFPSHTFTGHVDSLAPASGSQFALLPPDNATGNFTKVVQRIPVKITFDPESLNGFESQISPGMSATISVHVQE